MVVNIKRTAGVLGGLMCAGAAYLAWQGNDENESHQAIILQILKQQDLIIERHDARKAKLDDIEDEALAALLWNESIGFMYESLSALALPSGPNYGNEYTSSRFSRLEDYESAETLTDTYLSSYSVRFAEEFGRECFSIQEPFNYPFSARLEWKEIAFNNGEVVNFSDISQEPFISQHGRRCIGSYPVDHEAEPVTLEGEFFARLPSHVLEVEFDPEDIGSTKNVSGIAVKLISMSEYSYEIEVNVAQSDAQPLGSYEIVGEAISENGRYAIRNASISEPLSYYLDFEALLDDLVDRLSSGELDEKQIRQEIMAYRDERATEKHVHYRGFGFSAAIETAKVTLLLSSEDAIAVSQEINASVFSRQAFAADESEVSSRLYFDKPIYDDRYILQGEHSDYDSDELLSLIDVRQEQQSREYRQEHEYSDKVYFDYPAVASDLFIDPLARYQNPGYDDVRFIDAYGNRIEVPASYEHLYRFMVNRVEYNPHLFAEYPFYLEVTLPVQTASDIVKRRFSLEDLPNGLEIKENMLIIDHSSFSFEAVGLESNTTSHFFVKGEDGLYLKEVTRASLPNEVGSAREIRYFYGLPESLEIWQSGEIKIVELKVGVELLKPLEEQESAFKTP